MTAALLSMPSPIGAISKADVADCIRKWAAGTALDERERAVVDRALVQNRVDVIQQVFHDLEGANVD